MFRRPKYLEIPWEIHWRQKETEPQRHLWWPMTLLIFGIMLVIGVGVTSGAGLGEPSVSSGTITHATRTIEEMRLPL